MIVRLPHQFSFRPFQRSTFKACFVDGKRDLVDVIHRRAGKTKNTVNLALAAGMKRVGTCYHLFPQLNQARRVVWNGIDKEGKRYLDHVPKQLIANVNNTEMRIDLINGSILQLAGSDRYNSLVGGNPIFVAYDEYSLQHPMAAHYLRPITAENGGINYYPYTPRGRNHGWELFERATKNPDSFFVQRLTVDDTGLISQDIINNERAAGVPEELIQQEYYCSFDASLVGSYYGQSLERAYKEGRVCDFPINPKLPVYTFWDLGFSDYTTIWFMQSDGGKLYLIYYYENHGEYIKHYADKLKEIQQKLGITYRGHFAPHDVKKNWVISERSPEEIARGAGINFYRTPNIGVQKGIDMARAIFPNVYFHKTNCALGIKCISEYKKKWDDKKKIFNDEPEHNWASHGADAFRYFAVGWHSGFSIEQTSGVIDLG